MRNHFSENASVETLREVEEREERRGGERERGREGVERGGRVGRKTEEMRLQ